MTVKLTWMCGLCAQLWSRYISTCNFFTLVTDQPSDPNVIPLGITLWFAAHCDLSVVTEAPEYQGPCCHLSDQTVILLSSVIPVCRVCDFFRIPALRICNPITRDLSVTSYLTQCVFYDPGDLALYPRALPVLCPRRPSPCNPAAPSSINPARCPLCLHCALRLTPP